jgi:hypothetical protein
VRQFARWALKPFVTWIARGSQGRDPWERLSYEVPDQAFGRGSVHPFPWYFEGESVVEVACVDDICAWLSECRYVRDPDLFNESDFWQHPRTFERLREGDCEDHALWAWRKLVELGLDAELMSGTWSSPTGEVGGHVWVRYREDGRAFILESVGGTRERMVRAFDDVKGEYVPHAGVDRRFKRYAYCGYLGQHGGS